MRKCFVCGDSEEKTRVYASKWSNGRDVCNKHWNQLKRHGRVIDNFPSRRKEKRVCDYCDRENNVTMFTNSNSEYSGKLLCTKHKSQVRVYGHILERTKFDKNEILVNGKLAEVILYDIKKQEIARAVIDKDDIHLVEEYKWSYDKLHNYACTADSKLGYLGMHQLIMETKGNGLLVDHIDRDGLNNRRSNLRMASKSVNAINIGLKTNNKSGVTGVSFSRTYNKWRSYINYDGKRIELGYFSSKEDAIISRLKAELQYYPDYPPQRHLFEKYNIGGAISV